MKRLLIALIFGMFFISLASATTIINYVGQDATNTGVDPTYHGVQIIPNINITLNNVTLYPGDTAPTCKVRYTNNSDIISVPTSASSAIFEVNLTAGTSYRVVCGGAGNMLYKTTTFISVNGTHINISNQIYDGGIDNSGYRTIKYLTTTNTTQVQPSSLILNLISPINGSSFSDTNISFSTNYSVIGYNFTNITYFVWNSTGQIFNRTTLTTSGDSFNSSSLIIYNFTLDNYYWNAQVCSTNLTNTLCNYSTQGNLSFSLGSSLSSYNFSYNSYETKNELFNFTFNILQGSQIALAELVYDGTSYPISDIIQSSNMVSLVKYLDIPLINVSNKNNSFYVKFTYGGGSTQQSSALSQNISSIYFGLCNSTFPTNSLNLSFYDELTQIPLVGASTPTSILATFRFWLGSGTIQKNYSFQNLTSSVNNYQLCISTNQTFHVDSDMQYYATTYADRTHYFRNQSFTNNRTNIILYNLLSSEATKFSTTLKQGTQVFTDAVVEVWKNFYGSGDFKKVMVGLTDDKGYFSANLDLDQNYNFIIIKDGVTYAIINKQASCASSPCEINLNIDTIILNPYDTFYNYFAQNIEYSFIDDSTNKTIYLNFEDKLGTSQYWRLYVYQNNYNNDSIITICDVKSFSSIGSLSCNYSAYKGDIRADVFISRSPEKLVNFLELVNNDAPSTFGESGILASIIILVILVLVGTRKPSVALILFPFGLVVLKFIGFLPLDWSWILGITIFDLWIISRLNQ